MNQLHFYKSKNPKKIIIIGGGAAGFFSAIHNKENFPDADVIVIEKSKEVLSKVKISGGGRCNVTHACFDPKQLCEFYPRGGKQLRGPFFSFQPRDTMDWFESRGVVLKIEDDNRVFPATDSSQTIIDCLVETATKLGVKIWTECGVNSISHNLDAGEKPEFSLVLTNNNTVVCQKLVLATGSNRVGYQFVENLGHSSVSPIPSLFTFKIEDKLLHQLSGLSVPNAEVWVSGNKKTVQSGPLLITHWGMSGPAIIKLSAWQAKAFFECDYTVDILVNWISDLSEEKVRQLLTKHKDSNPKKSVGGQSVFRSIPNRLWRYFVLRAQIGDLDNDQQWHSVSKKQFNRLVQELTLGTYKVTGKSAFKEEFVTCGGVTLDEVDLKTMQSKKCPGLYIVGELLDIDGVTGGFNFQNAWTTGFLSG